MVLKTNLKPSSIIKNLKKNTKQKFKNNITLFQKLSLIAGNKSKKLFNDNISTSQNLQSKDFKLGLQDDTSAEDYRGYLVDGVSGVVSTASNLNTTSLLDLTTQYELLYENAMKKLLKNTIMDESSLLITIMISGVIEKSDQTRISDYKKNIITNYALYGIRSYQEMYELSIQSFEKILNGENTEDDDHYFIDLVSLSSVSIKVVSLVTQLISSGVNYSSDRLYSLDEVMNMKIMTTHAVNYHVEQNARIWNPLNKDQYCLLWCIAACKIRNENTYKKPISKQNVYKDADLKEVFSKLYKKIVKAGKLSTLFNNKGFISKAANYDYIAKLFNIHISVYTLNEQAIPMKYYKTKNYEAILHFNALIVNQIKDKDDLINEDDLNKLAVHFMFIYNKKLLLQQKGTTSRNEVNMCFICDKVFYHNNHAGLEKHIQHHKNIVDEEDIVMNEIVTSKKQVFNEYYMKQPVIFSMVYDTESIITNENLHKCVAVGSQLICKEEYVKYIPTKYKDILKYQEFYGLDAMDQWINYLINLRNILTNILNQHKNSVEYKKCEKYRNDHFNACKKVDERSPIKCYYCQTDITKSKYNIQTTDIMVSHHNHMTGQYVGMTCNTCNLNEPKSKMLPIFAHNAKGYDNNHVLQKISLFSSKLNILAKSTEKFSSIEVGKSIVKEGFSKIPLRFLDSMNFLTGSLEGNFKTTSKRVYSKQVGITGKGIFPYTYINSLERLNEEQLPSKNFFFNDLKGKELSDEDYQIALDDFQGCNNIKEYMMKYMKADVAMLADIMVEFRQMIIDKFDSIDPFYSYTLPGLSFKLMLKSLNNDVDIISTNDIDIYKTLENMIQGGVSQIGRRYSKAEDGKAFNFYVDVTALYAYVMSNFKLPDFNYGFLLNEQDHKMKMKEKNYQIKNARENYFIEENIMRWIKKHKVYKKTIYNLEGLYEVEEYKEIIEEFLQENEIVVDELKFEKILKGIEDNFKVYKEHLLDTDNLLQMKSSELRDYLNDLDLQKLDYTYVFTVDIRYPKKLHSQLPHSTFPLCPENLKVDLDAYSEFQLEQRRINKMNHTVYNENEDDDYTSKHMTEDIKLIAHLGSKSNITLNAELLKFYLNKGLKIVGTPKSIIKQHHVHIMRDYVLGNAKQRSDNFHIPIMKALFKLLNNALYGRCLMNTRKFSSYELTTDPKYLSKKAANLNFQEFDIITADKENNQYLYGIKSKKVTVRLDAPIHIGATILNFAKLHLYSWLYDSFDPIAKEHGLNYSLLMTDTDSLAFRVEVGDGSKIKTRLDLYKELAKTNTMDFTSELFMKVAKSNDNSDWANQIRELTEMTKDNHHVMGKMTCESEIYEIDEFYGIKSKCYCMKLVDKNGKDAMNDKGEDISKTIKGKGVPESFRPTYEQHADLVENPSIIYTNFNTIRSKNNKLQTVNITKKTLTNVDDKVHILEDKINFKPLFSRA